MWAAPSGDECGSRDGYHCHPPAKTYYDENVPDFVAFVRGLIVDLFRPRAALLAENALLRQKLIVAERKLVGRVQWTPWQR
jgi:hypothetical protein